MPANVGYRSTAGFPALKSYQPQDDLFLYELCVTFALNCALVYRESK